MVRPMSIVEIPGLDAIRIRKENGFAGWGDRNAANRVEPLAQPDFDVPFLLEPGEKIFTIGSCFARNVESELMERGYRIPMRELFNTPEFEGLDLSIVNNFGTPSIYNELAWAFGEQALDEETAFAAAGPDRYVDLHMTTGTRPAPRDIVVARRQGLLQATRALAECRVIIMTLGLVELWWDAKAQLYLNTAPLPMLIKQAPDRFALHVLDFEQAHRFLDQAMDIIVRHGRDDVQVILTVSPVPIMATHRAQDVMAANCYSKSVLRAVAEHIVARYDQVSYFPSYESVTLSDRRLAWMSDLVHVTREMVAFNVGRMIDAFTDAEKPTTDLPDLEASDDGETPETLQKAVEARAAREAGDSAYFQANGAWSEKSGAFAVEHATSLQLAGKQEEALEIVAQWESPPARLLKAELLFALKRYDETIAAVAPLCVKEVKGGRQWTLALRALTAKPDVQGVLDLERRWMEARLIRPVHALLQIGRSLLLLERADLAVDRLVEVLERSREAVPQVHLDCADAMIRLGRRDEALALLETPLEWNAPQRKRRDQLFEEAKAIAAS